MFAATTSWVMVKNQPVIHSSIGTVIRLAIPITHRKQKTIIKQGKVIKQNQITNKETKVSQIYTNSAVTSVMRNGGRRKHKGTRCNKVETGGAGGDLRSRRGKLGLKSSQKG